MPATLRRAVWITAAALAAALLVAGVGALAWYYARPTLPPVAAVAANVDDGIVAVVRAAQDRAAVTISGLVATTGCTGGALTHGHRYTRTANLYTDPGTEDSLVTHIAAALPAGYRASRANPLGLPVAPLTAAAGAGVTLTVQVISPGWISASTATDCRRGPAAAANPTHPPGPAPGSITALYATLGTTLADWHADTIACPAGAITTTSAASAATDPAGIATRLSGAVPTGAHRVATPSNRLIWYTDTGSSTVIAAADDGTHITAQTTMSTC